MMCGDMAVRRCSFDHVLAHSHLIWLAASSLVCLSARIAGEEAPAPTTRLDFTCPEVFLVGREVRPLALADLEGDGLLEIVTGVSAPTLRILRGAPDRFWEHTVEVLPTIDPASAVAAADIDGARGLDLILATTRDTVEVLLSAEGGGFEASRVHGVGRQPIDLVVADFNEDTYLDVATANNNSGDVSILLRAPGSDSLFAASRQFPVGSGSSKIITRDLDGDTHLDLVVVNQGSDDVAILRGNGDGTFQERESIRTGRSPRGLASADFNQDGVLDLATFDEDDNGVALHFGLQGGEFAPAELVPLPFSSSLVLSVDLDENGAADLAVFGVVIAVLRSLGDGTFVLDGAYPVPDYPRDAAAADFDADGLQDLFVSDGQLAGTLSIFMNRTARHPPVDCDHDGVADTTQIGDDPSRDADTDGILDACADSQSVLPDCDGDGEPDAREIESGSSMDCNANGVPDGCEGAGLQPDLGNGQRHAAVEGIVALAVGDFNGDGAPDVAVGTDESDGLWTLINHGDGTFAEATRLPVEATANDLLAADLNDDGFQDLVLAQRRAAAHLLLLGSGTGTFVEAGVLPVGSWPPVNVLARDLDADGVIDLASTNRYESTTIFFGHGDGSFEPALTLPLTADPTEFDLPDFNGIAAGDLDGDGALDIVSGDFDGDVFVFLATGHRQYGSPRRFFSGGGGSIAVDDLSSDGFLDLLAARFSGIRYLRGSGDGTFLVPLTLPTSSDTSRVATADLDEDGDADILASLFSGGIAVMQGIDGKAFAASRDYATGHGDFSVVDVDRDGHLDVVSVSHDRGAIEVLLGAGNGTLRAGHVAALGRRTRTFRVADVDRNGQADLLSTQGEDVFLHRARPDGTFRPPVSIGLRRDALTLAVADVDEDDILDLVLQGTFPYRLSVARGRGDGTFGDDALLPGESGVVARDLVARDINGDGHVDVVITQLLPPGLRVVLGRGDGTFAEPNTLPTGAEPASIAVADLDGDGLLDLATANAGGPSVSVLLATIGGGFEMERTFPIPGEQPVRIAAADVDTDGALDLLTLNINTSDVSILLGDGAGGFESSGSLPTGREATSWAVGRIDGDGFVDVVILPRQAAEIAFHRGRGDGSFDAPRSMGARPGAFEMIAHDLDGDGRLDLSFLAEGDDGDAIVTYRNLTIPAEEDCNLNGLPDSCDIAVGDLADCNQNGLADACDLVRGAAIDCDASGVLDVCEIAGGVRLDLDEDGVPDSCQGPRRVPGDCNQDRRVDISDGLCVLNRLFGATTVLPCGDGATGDLANVLALDWTGDGRLDLSDGVAVFSFLFLGEAPHSLAENGACISIPACGGPDMCP